MFWMGNNNSLNYFIGSAFLANGQYEQALHYLRNNEKNTSSAFAEETNFYVGLTYLKMNETSKAIEYLEKCAIPKAKELLKSIQDSHEE